MAKNIPHGGNRFTINRIKELQRQGKIQGYTVGPKRRKHKSGKQFKHRGRRSAAKEFIEQNLQYWCNQRGLTMDREHKFDQDMDRPGKFLRQWKLDYAVASLKIAVEYEGIMSHKSRHLTITGYNEDTIKYNRAQELGWRIIRLTTKTYQSLVTRLNALHPAA